MPHRLVVSVPRYARLSLIALSVVSSATDRRGDAGQNAPPAKTPVATAEEKTPRAPGLERILKSWKARQDRVQLVHLAWDTKVPTVKQAGDLPPKDANFRVLHTELWLDGEHRSRIDEGFTRRGYSRIKNGDTTMVWKWRIGSPQSLTGMIGPTKDSPWGIGYELASEVNPALGWTSKRAV